MGFIGEVTFINQNMHIPSAIVASEIAREHLSSEITKQIEKDKETKVESIKDIEEYSEIDTNISKDEERNRDKELAKQRESIKKHIDLKG